MAAKLPTFDRLMNPLLRALKALGGSGSIEELYDKVVEAEKIPEEVIAQMHDPEGSNQTEVGYRLAWARTYLKKYGHLENSARGVWSLTAQGRAVEEVDPQEVVKRVRLQDKKEAPSSASSGGADGTSQQAAPPEVTAEETWKQRLHLVLTQSLSPAAFERLVQRVLRESGFVQVEVTGKTGDIENRGDDIDSARKAFRIRLLESLYLQPGFGVWVWSFGTTVEWDNRDRFIGARAVWTASVGRCVFRRSAFLGELERFDERLMNAMNDRIQIIARDWHRPDVKLDLPGLRADHADRTTWLSSALKRQAPTIDWQAVERGLLG